MAPIEIVPLAEVKLHPENPRAGDIEEILASILAHGFYGVCGRQKSTGYLIWGNHRFQALQRAAEMVELAGAGLLPEPEEKAWVDWDAEHGPILGVPIEDLDVDDEEALDILLRDNRSSDRAGYRLEALSDLLAEIEERRGGLEGTGWDRPSLDALIGGGEEPPGTRGDASRLADRFLLPPFSILDARQGWWQERKRAWLALGIRSEIGRPKNLLGMSETILEGSSDEGTSIFDPVLAELAIRWFCPPAGLIFDPFAGGSVRGIVAAKLGRTYCGLDISAAQLEANREQASEICAAAGPMPEWIERDARDGAPKGLAADFLLSCPPYFDLERYSDDPRDLSNTDWDGFLDGMGQAMKRAADALKPGRFAAFVIGNVRAGDEILDLASAISSPLKHAGLILYNEAILVTPAGNAAMRAAKIFRTRKLTRCHQQLLVFLKPPLEDALEACGPIEIADPAEMFGEPVEP